MSSGLIIDAKSSSSIGNNNTPNDSTTDDNNTPNTPTDNNSGELEGAQ